MSADERMDRYRLQEVIGVGSFATVHRATDDRLDTTVVLKVLAENHSLNPEVRERFITEGRALRRVCSPHVVTLFDMGESGRQQPYHVLEHADRGTLAARIADLRATGWSATPDDVLALARQLTLALTAVHRAQLVHRDLSPANVLLTSQGVVQVDALADETPAGQLVRNDERVLVADLGMCKDLARNSGLTAAGGTTGFRPPELSAGPAVIDERADLYSLSALLAWVCEGTTVPPALGAALDRGRAVDPDDRQPGVDVWLDEVTAAIAPPTASATTSAPREHGAGRRRRALVVLAAVLLLMLGGLLASFALSRSPDDSTRTAAVSISGPTELVVGTRASFTVEQQGVRSWVWTLPDGRYLSDEATVTVIPSSPGSAQVVLTASDDEGRELRAVHDLEVVDGAG